MKDYNEIIQLLIWAYKQGYLHASQVLKDTVPDDKQLYEMFKKSIEDKQSVKDK
jgi:hypothetical protein